MKEPCIPEKKKIGGDLATDASRKVFYIFRISARYMDLAVFCH